MRTCVSIVHERRTHIIHGQLLLYELINRQHLSVFVLRSGGAIMRSDGIRVDVKARIAPYKYPRSVVFVDALPKTTTGKIQRFKLRESA